MAHGLLARDLLLPDENPAELEDFSSGLHAQLAPDGPVETMLVDRVIACAWKLARANRLEVEVLERDRYDGTEDRGLAISLLRDTNHGDVFSKVLRYEGALERGMMRALHELERHQAARRGQVVPAPIAVDVDVNVSGGAIDDGE